MTIPGAIEAATSAIGLANAIADAYAGRRHDPQKSRKVVQALRSIYFTPGGTLRVLKTLAEGGRPEVEQVMQALLEFNDAEWEVDKSLERLDFKMLGNQEHLSLRQRRELDGLVHGKRELRRDIQNALNERLTKNERVDAGEAKVLLLRVESLNRLIESLEEELL